jgi:hypothetical protein
VAQVQGIQAAAKKFEDDEEGGLHVLRSIVEAAVEGGSELTAEDFASFPMDELKQLSDTIMEFSGISQDENAGK